MLTRSFSLPHDAIIRLPPDEDGLIALLCATNTVHANSASAPSPVEAASAGISRNNAGATTPVVDEKKLMNTAAILNAIGTDAAATFEPIHYTNISILSLGVKAGGFSGNML